MGTMRVGLGTWLKQDCADIGMKLLDSLWTANMARKDMGGLYTDEDIYSTASAIRNELNHSIAMLGQLPPGTIKTIDEYQPIANLRDKVSKLLDEYASTKSKNTIDTIYITIEEIKNVLEKYLLEKVVECQCGKQTPEELDRLNRKAHQEYGLDYSALTESEKATVRRDVLGKE